MKKGRVEAFSDGVIAIIITIMVLELKVPHGGDFEAIKKLAPVFLSYILSFVYVGIYWNNHHHMFQAVRQINGATLWANLHLLFWLSLIPFSTGWMGENHFLTLTVALYGVNLLMCGLAFFLLARTLVKHHGHESELARAFGKDTKTLFSLVAYTAGVALAFVDARISLAIYVLVAIVWFIPDRRIERVHQEVESGGE